MSDARAPLPAARGELLPSLGLVLGAALWGLYWIPVRGIEHAGVAAIWVGPVVFAATLILFLPLAIRCRRGLRAHWRRILLPGLLSGFAIALYIASLNFTDVVRAVLLFYLTPLWSTLLGMLVLKERLTVNRVLGLLLALAGLYVVLVTEQGLPLPRNLGDWLALGSGLCWSVASVRLFQDGTAQLAEKLTLFVFFGLVASLAMLPLHADGFGAAPTLAALERGAGWILVVALMMVPITWLTIWPTTLLSPARVGMLLLMDVIVGVTSAAWLAGEPFGARELTGAVLVVAAGVVEVIRAPSFAARRRPA